MNTDDLRAENERLKLALDIAIKWANIDLPRSNSVMAKGINALLEGRADDPWVVRAVELATSKSVSDSENRRSFAS